VKKLYYATMYQVCDLILWAKVNDSFHFARWREASEYYRRKRDNA
jgi:hypothetical protein